MLIVRETFTAKPGQAGRLAKLWKRTMGRPQHPYLDRPGRQLLYKIMTGDAVARLAGGRRNRSTRRDASTMIRGCGSDEGCRQYLTGKREVFQVVE